MTGHNDRAEDCRGVLGRTRDAPETWWIGAKGR